MRMAKGDVSRDIAVHPWQLYKEAGPPEAYYKSALMLLAYTPMESLKREQVMVAAS